MSKKISFVFLLLVITGILLINCTNESSGDTANTAHNDSLQQSIARGDYLANNVAGCFDCHSKRDFKYFAGPLMPGTEGMGGEIFDNNLNQAFLECFMQKILLPIL
jgi:hypothetical protein